MTQIKVVAFDMEGTIFRKSYKFDFIKDRFPENWQKLCQCHGEDNLATMHFSSAWTLLCDLLGPVPSKINQENWKKWNSGGYPGYSEWVLDTIMLHQEHGLTKDLFEAVIHQSTEYHSGAAELFSALKSQGITLALISGGLKSMAERVTLDFKFDHFFASAEYFWNEDGTIRHWNCQPTDFTHKRRIIEMLLHDLDISKEECVFIGDGGNDRHVAEHVGWSIGFNPDEHTKAWWKKVIEQEKGQESMLAILDVLASFSMQTEE